MPRFDVYVVQDKTALIKLDDLFPECETFSSARTPRLVCLPEPQSCAACKSLGSLIQRVSQLFDHSEWELIVLFWELEDGRMRAVACRKEDPAEVQWLIVNKSGLELVTNRAEEYVVDLSIYF
jgi:hypothetical protein